jgi:hypothetical protein
VRISPMVAEGPLVIDTMPWSGEQWPRRHR